MPGKASKEKLLGAVLHGAFCQQKLQHTSSVCAFMLGCASHFTLSNTQKCRIWKTFYSSVLSERPRGCRLIRDDRFKDLFPCQLLQIQRMYATMYPKVHQHLWDKDGFQPAIALACNHLEALISPELVVFSQSCPHFRALTFAIAACIFQLTPTTRPSVQHYASQPSLQRGIFRTCLQAIHPSSL